MLTEKTQSLFKMYFTFVTIMGIPMMVTFFNQPSEIDNQILFGLSPARLLIGFIFSFLIFVSGWLGVSFWIPKSMRRQKILDFFESILLHDTKLYIALTILYGWVLFSGALIFLPALPVAEQSEFFIGVILRLKELLIWSCIAVVFLLGLTLYITKTRLIKDALFSPLRTVIWVWMFFYAYSFVLIYYRKAAHLLSLKQFEEYIFWSCVFLGIWVLTYTYLPKSKYKPTIDRVFFLLGIFLTVLVFYANTASWLGWIHKRAYERWDVLAEQFLEGKLYVPLPPNEHLTHDLTFYKGNWYIPNPPLPAILVMPLALFLPANDIHMGDISMVFSGFNAVLVFLILEQLKIRKWVELSTSKALWFTALFACGTNHLWVGINGAVWFFSQIVTVTFLGIAVYTALKGWSPWIIGLGIGLAISSRPNSLMTFPFVFAIAMQIYKEKYDEVNLGNILNWGIKSSIPIVLAVGGLLIYNYARFEDWLDFGYVTINGAEEIVYNAKTYGVFSTKFIPHNLHIMFLNPPNIKWDSPWLIFPDRRGISIFLSTPVFLYLIRKYEMKWWILGAWTAIFCNIAMLAMYHNTGSAQFGYRYILDMIIPIMSILPLAFPKKLPWHFFVLLFCSIVINIYGTAWFIIAE